jgi:predicted glutamine amidotransferase
MSPEERGTVRLRHNRSVGSVRAVLPIKPANDIGRFSLEAFARRGGRDGRNVDGWGLAYYDDRDVRLYREPEPAGDRGLLSFVERRRIASTLVLSHIRHSARGRVSLANTQPFARELGGRLHVFAHNGRLDDIESRHASEWDRFQPIGETDSEIAFCILLERLSELLRSTVEPSLDARRAVVERFADMASSGRPISFMPTGARYLRTRIGAYKRIT